MLTFCDNMTQKWGKLEHALKTYDIYMFIYSPPSWHVHFRGVCYDRGCGLDVNCGGISCMPQGMSVSRPLRACRQRDRDTFLIWLAICGRVEGGQGSENNL